MNYLKNILIALLIAAVLIQAFATVGVIMRFQANQDYYARVLCVNKNRPELACHGKCFLMQQLQSEFEQEQSAERQHLQKLLDRDTILFCNHFTCLNFKVTFLPFFQNTENPLFINQLHPLALCSAIFRPPIALA
ncbi:MAG: hypothetical protein RLZZ628_1888 [Bacteroidota bacterium]|jgi:hypothetical protein